MCNLITIQFNNDGWHKIVLVNDSMNSLNNANSQIWQFLMRHIILLNIDNILKTLHISLFASIDRFDLVLKKSHPQKRKISGGHNGSISAD